MDSDDRLSLRVAHIKEALHDLTSSLQPYSPYVRPSTSAGFLLSDYDDQLLSSSSRSEVYALRRQLEWTEGKARRLEEKLMAMEGTCREMNELMQELYRTVEELQDEKRRTDEALVHMKDVELHYDSLRKQITSLQSALSQKEHLLSQFQQDQMSLLKEPSPTTQFLTTEVQRLEREKEAESRRRKEEAGELQHRLLRLEEDFSHVCREKDSLAGTLTAKDAAISDLREQIYEKQLVAEAYKKPAKLDSKEFRSFFVSVTNLLGDQSPTDLLATINSLQQSHKQAPAAVSLVSKLGKLIQDCAPAEAETGKLNAKQIWRWVRRLVEEFMRLKERCEAMERDWTESRKLLGVKSQADLLPALAQVLQDLRQLQSLEGKVKALVSDPIKIQDN
jgi:myosin heavy subunit